MITKELFIKYLTQYQRFNSAFERIEEALMGKPYSSNLYESDWCDSVGYMLDIFLQSHFTEEGCDLICWWLFEDVEHIITQTVTPDLFNGKSEIEYDVNNIEDLWNYLTKFPSDYFKQDLKG